MVLSSLYSLVSQSKGDKSKMLMVEPKETDPCICGHMIKSNKIKVDRNPEKPIKSKCRYCNCRSLEIA